MSLADLRDLFIVIFCCIAIGMTILLAILSFLVFRKVRSILDSGRETAANIRRITSLASEGIAKPLVGVSSFLQGVRHAVDFMSGSSRRKEGRSRERGE